MKSSVIPLPPPTAAARSGSKASNTVAKSPHRHHVTSNFGLDANNIFGGNSNNNNISSNNNNNSNSSSNNNNNTIDSSASNTNPPSVSPLEDGKPIELKSHVLLQQLVAGIDPSFMPPTNDSKTYRPRQPEARKELLYLNSILDDMMIDLRKDICNQNGLEWQPDKMITPEDDQQSVNSTGDDNNDTIVTQLSVTGVRKAKRLKSNYLHHFEMSQKIYNEKSKMLREELEVTKRRLVESELERASYAAIVGNRNPASDLDIESFNRQLGFEEPARPSAPQSSFSSSSSSSTNHQLESLSVVIEKLLNSMTQDTSVHAKVTLRNIRENKLSGNESSDAVKDIIMQGTQKMQDLCRTMAIQVDKERKAARRNVESLSLELLATQQHIEDLTSKNLELSKKLQEKDIRIAKSIQFQAK